LAGVATLRAGSSISPGVTEARRFRGEVTYAIRPLTAGETVSIPFERA
jgi:hypothetical protein